MGGVSEPPRSGSSAALSFWVYAVSPVAFVMLMMLRRYGFVSGAPWWAYAAAILGSSMINKGTEGWREVTPGSLRLHVRVLLHVVAVTATIYLSGWGPVLGMAFLFSAQIDFDQTGAAVWRAVLGWSLFGCAVGQFMILFGWAPTFLPQSEAQTVGLLGAFVFAIAIRKAGETGVYKETIEAALARQAVLDKQAQEAARLSEERHRAVVENAAEGIVTVGLDGKIISFNGAAEAMFGWTAREIIDRSIEIVLPPELHRPFADFLLAYSVEGGPLVRRDVEVEGVRRDGSRFPMMVALSIIEVEGHAPMITGLLRDLSEQKHFEDQLAHLALHDALTGIANRVMLTDRLDQALARVRRNDSMLGVLFVDLDRFKPVNDKLGHTAGDQILVETAARIRNAVRETDTVARFGGDEFVVLFEAADAVRHATDFARRIVQAIEQPFMLGEHEAMLSASIGIALSATGSESADDMLRNADTAMYRAKHAGRGRYELFDEAMQYWVATRLELEIALRAAVTRGEFRVHYQPIVNAESGAIAGFEALVRWERPGFGLVPPSEFIAVAEETGLIFEIGTWVLEESCRQAASWAQRWPDRHLGISVNMSSRQILGSDIVGIVGRALAATQLDPTLLTLELTESSLIDNAVGAAAALHRLRDLGVNLALDDFGTGYCSLTYLRAFPINIIKVDQSFVRSIGTEREDTAIVAAVIGLAKNLDLHVVAEGIDTHQQLAALVYLQCDYLQGYLFAPPTEAGAVPALVDGPILGQVAGRDSIAR